MSVIFKDNFGVINIMEKTDIAALILNGDFCAEKIQADYIVCADGGYNLLKKRGIMPDIIIGDNDSVKNREEIPAEINRLNFPTDKDMTDGELALRHIAGKGFKNLLIFGALGGRQDHVESNLALLCLAAKLGVRAVIQDEKTEIHYIDGRFNGFSKKIPENVLISIVPFYSVAHIINTKGLKYPLKDKRLFKYSSLGVSNLTLGGLTEVNISS
jgi:thiamine pyrophosphokinase